MPDTAIITKESKEKVEKLKYIDYEDFLGGGISPVLYETIYDSSKLFLRERKKEECSS